MVENELELALELPDRASGDVQYQAVEEDDTCLQRHADLVQRRLAHVLWLVHLQVPAVVEGFDAREQCLAARLPDELQVLVVEEEVARHQRRPTSEASGLVHLTDQLELDDEVLSIRAVEVVVDEGDVRPPPDGANLRPDQIDVVSQELPTLGREAAERAAEVAVAARFHVPDASYPIGELEARLEDLAGRGRAEGVPYDRVQLLDIAEAGIVEEGPAEAGQGAHGVAAGDDDHAWIQRAGVGAQVQHAIECAGEAGQHQHVRPTQEATRLQRAPRLLVVEPDVAAIPAEGARQEDRCHRLRHLVGAAHRVTRVVQVAVDDEDALPAAGTAVSRSNEGRAALGTGSARCQGLPRSNHRSSGRGVEASIDSEALRFEPAYHGALNGGQPLAAGASRPARAPVAGELSSPRRHRATGRRRPRGRSGCARSGASSPLRSRRRSASR